ncbi:MAG: cupin domain-containing protein [Chloroflexota bacterium]|nr:cupin domain-containing protein [Chloroflexota bacterium]
MMVVRPGEGRVPYVPFERRTPAYSGKIVVAREDGIVEKHSQGSFIKLLCKETTGDERFTLGERIYEPGLKATPYDGDSEAIHVLKGQGVFKAWLEYLPKEIEVPLQPGMEIVVMHGTKRLVQNTTQEPLVAVVTICHEPFPAYAHHYPAIFEPGKGNSLHMHDNRVEGFYVIEGPGAMSMADPDSHVVRDVIVPPGGVGYKPMYVYHRQFNPGTSQELCYWIHSMCVFTHRGSRMPQLHIRQHGLDGKTPRWERQAQL